MHEMEVGGRGMITIYKEGSGPKQKIYEQDPTSSPIPFVWYISQVFIQHTNHDSFLDMMLICGEPYHSFCILKYGALDASTTLQL